MEPTAAARSLDPPAKGAAAPAPPAGMGVAAPDAGTVGAADAAGGAASPQAAAGEPESSSEASFVVEARSVHSERTFLGGQQFFDQSTTFKWMGSLPKPRLTARQFQEIDGPRLERAAAGLVAEPATVDALLGVLETHRLLVMRGEPRLGKGSLAILLADRLVGRHGCAGALVCSHALEKDLQVSIDDLTDPKAAADFGQRVLVLDKPLAAGNADLLRFLQGLDALAVENLQRSFQQRGAFLILTADHQHLEEGLCQQLTRLGLLGEPQPPSAAAVERLLRRRAERLAATPGCGAAAALRTFVAAHAAEMAARLRTPPRVEEFVADRLLRVVGGEQSLDAALANLDDLAPWLLAELPQDFDAWVVALTLALCGAAPDGGGVPWLPFQTLRRRLARTLRHQLELAERERQPADACRDLAVWALATADAGAAGAASRGSMRFEDPARAALLWEVLLSAGSSILGAMLPLLREVMGSDDGVLSAIAARALGRLGELDPENLTLAAIGDELRREPAKVRCAVIGQVVQGALGSADAVYRASCDGVLAALVVSDDIVHAVIATLALQEIGGADLGLVLRRLRQVVEERLAPAATDRGRLAAHLRQVERHFHRLEAAGWPNQQPMRLDDMALNSLPKLFSPAEAFELYRACKLTLAGLFTPPRCPALIAELARWTEGDRPCAPGAIASLAFLDLFGVADALTESRVQGPAGETTGGQPDGGDADGGSANRSEPPPSDAMGGDEPVLAGQLLGWLAMLSGGRGGAVDSLAALLRSTYRQLAYLPGLLCHALRQRWLLLLSGWTAAAAVAGDGATRELVIQLVCRLLPTGSAQIDEAARQVSAHLRRLQERTGTPAARLAREILTRVP